MNREPDVSAFLQSICQNLGEICRLEPSNTSYMYYDPSQDLKNLKEKMASFQDLLADGEARRLGEESVDEWMNDIKHLLSDVKDILNAIKSLSNNEVHFHELYITSKELERRLGEILLRTDVIVVRAKDLALKRGSSYANLKKNSQAIRGRPETSSIVEISEIHGREEDQKFIVERLFIANDKVKKNYDVLCIVGMRGLGKTILAQLAFNNPKVEKHFDVRSWVCIADIFDVGRATKALIENSNGGGSQGDQQSLAGLQMRLKDMIRNKRFLFVLDDVWSLSGWEKLKVPFCSCANGSKILVTTRDINIAHVLGIKEPYELQRLEYEQCMAIFEDKAFGDDEGEHEKLNLGEKIVKACGGVPLLVKVIGSMLRGAEEEKWRAVSEKAARWDAASIENDEIWKTL